ncbi:hypothetical protein HBN50_11260 [Halobacteriovorax sp. GB3]|uniref:hypothetical protein n=1 Tax=Halobacteriovorax sp. GB3 TaxID=2719615 RepID=UPI002361267D|nr:hypothetical protein [Halobacteriovorax sp. GB3]MDD0853678.1 hypothetical protein [Halobacteriovorax sp. GB3]
MVIKRKVPKNKGQLEFDFKREQEPDRNFHLGGRSFYFFDFDDNVAFLSTPVVIFHKKTGEEKILTSGEFGQQSALIGKEGPYADYTVDLCDAHGSFRYCRDQEISIVDRVKGKKQRFILDIEEALKLHDFNWKAPSWSCFYHATFNKRPMSVITARGHHPETIKNGIDVMVRKGHLPHRPNYLSIYPVSNPQTRADLGDPDLTTSIAELKRKAIFESVEKAIETYGYSNHHRFGMSDDDPKNVELVTEAMKELKRKYTEMSFFVIQTYEDSFEKREVLEHRTDDVIKKDLHGIDQLPLFS